MYIREGLCKTADLKLCDHLAGQHNIAKLPQHGYVNPNLESKALPK